MKNQQSKTKPAAEVRFGNIRAAIWKNEGKKNGGVFFTASIERVYRDDEGEFRTSNSFGRDDLLLLAKVADVAHSRIFELQHEEYSESESEE
jgi:hypothetical protein